MKKIFLDIKTLIAELIGLFGGFLWARGTNWDYEPLILFIISLVSLLLTLGLHFFKNGKIGKKFSQEDKNIFISNLDANKITTEIENTLPYLRNQVESNYIGMGINWDVSLDSIKKKKGSVYHVTTLYKGNYPWIYFDIDIEQFSFFKIAQKNHPLTITGRIKNIGGNTFTIDIMEIY
jgi:hypothetical protein